MESPWTSPVLGLTLGQPPGLSCRDGSWGKENHVHWLKIRRGLMCEGAWNADAIKIKLTCYASIITPLTSIKHFIFQRWNNHTVSAARLNEGWGGSAWAVEIPVHTYTSLFIAVSSQTATWKLTGTDIPTQIQNTLKYFLYVVRVNHIMGKKSAVGLSHLLE